MAKLWTLKNFVESMKMSNFAISAPIWTQFFFVDRYQISDFRNEIKFDGLKNEICTMPL